MTDKKPKKPEPKASVTLKEFLGVPKKAPLLVDVEVPPALAAVIPGQAEPEVRKGVAIAPLASGEPPDRPLTVEAREHGLSPERRAEIDALNERLSVAQYEAARDGTRVFACPCCGNPKSGGVACVVCGN